MCIRVGQLVNFFYILNKSHPDMCIPCKSEKNMKKMSASLLTFIGKVMLFQVMPYIRVQCFFSSKDGVNGYQKTQISKI
jgi:hypothetical protein